MNTLKQEQERQVQKDVAFLRDLANDLERFYAEDLSRLGDWDRRDKERRFRSMLKAGLEVIVNNLRP